MAARRSAARETEMEANYVIVGAGSAGCVLANRLTENPATRVVLIEAGGRDWNPLIHSKQKYTAGPRKIWRARRARRRRARPLA